MLSTSLNFLITTVFNLLTLMLLLRFFMQLFRAPFYNPIGKTVITLTDFIVKPARKFIPSWKGNDLSTLILAFATQFILKILLLWLSNFPFLVADGIWSHVLLKSLFGTLVAAINLFFYVVILQVILSWVNPHTPMAPILSAMTRPILNPIRKIIPIINGIDFSPMAALILLQMINVSIMQWS